MGGTAGADRVRTSLAALAGAGLDLDTFRLTAVETLRRVLPFDAACFATLDPATVLLTSAVKWGNLDDDHDLAWAYHEYEADDVYDFHSLARRPGGVVVLSEATHGDPVRSRRYAELFRPTWDFSDELRATFAVDGVTWGGLALFHEGRRTFTVAEQEFVASLGATVARGVRAALVTEHAAQVDHPGEEGPGVLVVGPDDAVAQCNAAAAARVADLGPRTSGRWVWGGGPLPHALEVLVAAARRAAVTGATMPRTRLRTRGGRWVVAHASPLVSRSGPGTDVVVTVEDARPPEIVPLVVAAYGFSAREREVVGLVLRGVGTAEIAGALHLSTWTVQDHLKKVFEKVGVRSRRELIARVYSDHYAPQLTSGASLAPSGGFAPA